ncbi:WD40 repeat domain-containing protein [Phycisphaeraceae bacterium D3-23]
MKPRTRIMIVLSIALGVALLLLGVFVWPGSLGRSSHVDSSDPQPPTQGLQGGPARDEVASDLIGRPVYTYAVHALAFSDDSAYLALGAGDGGVMRIELALLLAHAQDPEHPSATRLAAHDDWAFAIAFLDDASIVTGGGDNRIVRWDADLQQQHVFEPGGHTNDVHAIAVAPDQRRMYSAGDDRRLIAWDLDDGSVVYDITPHDEQVPALELSPDGAVIATGSRDDHVRLFDAQSGGLLRTLDSHEGDVLDLAFSPDGEHLASVSYDTTVRVHEVRTGALIKTLRGSNSRQFAIAYSADGRYLAAGGESGKIVIYDAADGYSIAHRLRTDADISRLAFSPDGQWLAASSSSGAVMLYGAQTFTLVESMRYEVVEEEE